MAESQSQGVQANDYRERNSYKSEVEKVVVMKLQRTRSRYQIKAMIASSIVWVRGSLQIHDVA